MLRKVLLLNTFLILLLGMVVVFSRSEVLRFPNLLYEKFDVPRIYIRNNPVQFSQGSVCPVFRTDTHAYAFCSDGIGILSDAFGVLAGHQCEYVEGFWGLFECDFAFSHTWRGIYTCTIWTYRDEKNVVWFLGKCSDEEIINGVLGYAISN